MRSCDVYTADIPRFLVLHHKQYGWLLDVCVAMVIMKIHLGALLAEVEELLL